MTPVNREASIEAAGLSDGDERSRFGFDADEETWLKRCRGAMNGPAPGHLGPYRLLGDAGRGSQGSVYKAVQPGTGRIVAIKRLGAGRFATPNMRARFELEILALASLNHPGIVTVFGADEVEEQRILLMEWVHGGPIDEWARARTVRERLKAFALTCDAVAHAHRRGVIHRDLKPSNILVDGNGQPHVLDFGLARLAEDEGGLRVSLTGGFVGTPAYAAPEQLTGRSEDVDTRTDVYALGVVLYELMTGARPIEHPADLGKMVDAIRHQEPRAPSTHQRELGAEVDAIALKALAKDPAQRYQSVTELGDDVRRHLSGEAVLAHPPSRAYRARKFVRRHRTGVVACAAVVLAILGGAAATALQAVRATRAETQMAGQRDAARTEARRADAVRDFLTTMLSDAGPRAGRTRDLTVRDALDKAAAKLDAGSLKDEPEIEEAIRWSLASAYIALGSRATAAAQFEWIVKYREQKFGARSTEVADGLYWWGSELNGCGQYDRAVSVLERSVEIYRESGPGKWQRIHPLLSLAEVERRKGRLPEAERDYQELIQEFEKAAPKYARELAWSIYGLALTYRDQGRRDECVAALERARPLVERSVAPGTRPRLWFADDYCLNVLEPAQRYQEVIDMMRPLLDSTLEAFGIQDRNIAGVVVVLARALIETGRGAEAEPLLRGVLEAQERRVAADAVPLLATRSLLGAALGQAGRIQEAEPLLVSSFEVLDTKADALERFRALRHLILFYEALGREDEAALYRARVGPPK